MKLRSGEPIACSKGHHVGFITVDVAASGPVPAEALSVSGPALSDARQGYVCGQCGEAVALLEDGYRWQVRLARGWVE